MKTLISTFGDSSYQYAIQYIPQLQNFFPTLNFTNPITIVSTDIKEICHELDLYIDVLNNDKTMIHHILLFFSSSVLVPYFQGDFREYGKKISIQYPNIKFYVGLNPMANPNNYLDSNFVLDSNQNVYRFADVTSGKEIEDISIGLKEIWNDDETHIVLFVYQENDNASLNALQKYEKSVEQLGWSSIKYPIQYDQNKQEFNLLEIRKIINDLKDNKYIICTAVNGQIDDIFTRDALISSSDLPAYFNVNKTEIARWAYMNYTPTQTLPVSFYFVEYYALIGECKIYNILKTNYQELYYYIEAVNWIFMNSINHNYNISFVGTCDVGFYLNEHRSRIAQYLIKSSPLNANQDKKTERPYLLRPNPLNPY
jgi:hypothetical protein